MAKLFWILAILVACSADLTFGKKKNRPIVDIADYGKIQGEFRSTAWTNKRFLKFRNIKYAVSEERFKPSIPYVPSNETLASGSSSEEVSGDEIINFMKSGIVCPSLETLGEVEWDSETEGIEDCLFITISTKNKTGNQPVMVYLAGHDAIRKENDLHEGSPSYLMEKDIVLVSVQYRVGPFGFLSALTPDMPGNVGILDVIEALRWIQKYIVHFGGDPTRVTLFGQYHSAALINILTMTPLIEKENLFTQVIYQSGSALLENITTDKPLDWTKKLAGCLKCESVEDMVAVAKCLKSANIQDLLKAYQSYVEENDEFAFITIGGPSGVLPESPQALYKAGKFRAYPTVGGSVKHPGICSTLRDINSTTFRTEFKKDLDVLKEVLMKVGTKNEDQAKYIDDKFPNKIFSNNILKAVYPALIDIKGIDIKYATSQALKYNSEKGSPSFLYIFNYIGSFSRLDCSLDVLSNDISLSDDNVFLFPYPKRVENLSSLDIKFAKFMIELWTTFAANGKPSAHGLRNWPVLQTGIFGPYLGIDYIYKIGYDFSEEYFITLKDQLKDVNIYT